LQYGVYYVPASVVSAEMRWASNGWGSGTLKMMITSVRTDRTTGCAPSRNNWP